MDRQKMLMIFGGAWLSAALLTWLVYSMTKAPRYDKTASVWAAARDLPTGTRLQKGDLKQVKVGDKDLAKGAITDDRSALGHPLLFPVNLNEPITVSKLASANGPEGVAALIEPGKRAVSVAITDVSGAAGLIMPRSHVDVLFTKPGTMAEAVTTTVLQDAVVLSVGRLTEVSATPPATATTGAGANAANLAASTPASTQTRAVTLLVTPEQAEKVELAKNQGKVSLSLRNPLDKESMTDSGATTTANLFSPTALRQRSMGKGAWSSLTGEERPVKIEKPIKEPPPKPRNVVDVYRGEKHVQEIFQ